MSNADAFDFSGLTGESDEPIARVPGNYYAKLATACTDPDQFVLNQYNVDNWFPGALEDLDGITEQAILGGQFDSIPRLAVTRKYMAVRNVPMTEFEQFYAHRKAQAMQQTRELIGGAKIRRLEATTDYQMASETQQQAIRMTALPSMSDMTFGNLSQHIRLLQDGAWGHTQKHFIAFVNQWARVCAARNVHYAIRPPLNLTARQRGRVFSLSPAAGIPIPELHHTPSQNLLLDNVLEAGLGDMIFRPLYEDSNKATENHINWKYWDSLAAFATAWIPSGAAIAIVPAALPPWLLFGGESAAVVYHEAWPLGTYSEQAVLFHPFDPAKPWYPNQTPAPSEIHPHMIARGLSLICIGLTLWASMNRMGKGFKNPTWTATPMNAPLIGWFVEELHAMNQEFLNA